VDARRRERAQLQQEAGDLRTEHEAAQAALRDLEFKHTSLQQHQAWMQQQLEEMQTR